MLKLATILFAVSPCFAAVITGGYFDGSTGVLELKGANFDVFGIESLDTWPFYAATFNNPYAQAFGGSIFPDGNSPASGTVDGIYYPSLQLNVDSFIIPEPPYPFPVLTEVISTGPTAYGPGLIQMAPITISGDLSIFLVDPFQCLLCNSPITGVGTAIWTWRDDGFIPGYGEYYDTSSIALVFGTAPEPSTWLLLAGGSTLLWTCSRFSKRTRDR
jgi:hypothetical protein